jgi:RNA polymerase sigma-70 factor (ECF subfamily)
MEENGYMEQCSDREEDLAVIKKIFEGNVDAYEHFLLKYERYVFTILSRHLPRENVREEAHDVFVKAYTSISGYSGKSDFRHWLATIALRHCHDFWRERYKGREMAMSELTEEHNEWFEAVVASASLEAFKANEALGELHKEGREVLAVALKKLGATDRMVISLIYFEELSAGETAKLLGINVMNVKVRAHRARNKLHGIISKLLKKAAIEDCRKNYEAR